MRGNAEKLLVLLGLLGALGYLSISTAVAGGVSLLLNEQQEHYPASAHLQYLEDPQNEYTFDAVRSELSPRFNTNTSGVLNLGFTHSAYWIRLTVDGEQLSHAKQWLLEIDFPSINQLNFYEPDGAGGYNQVLTGTDLPFHTRPYHHRNFIFPITIQPDEVKTYYFRAQATNALQFPVTIWSKPRFERHELVSLLAWGGFLGMIFIMTLYNLFIFLSVRDKSYLYYIFYINSVAMIVLSLNGLGFELFWSDNPEWNRRTISAFSASLVYFAIQFGRNFLHTPQNTPFLDGILIAISSASLVLIVGSIFFSYDFSSVATFVVLSFAVTILITGVSCWQKGVRSAKYFLTAWIVFLAGLLLFTLCLYAILPSNLITNHAKEVGAALEMMLLSLGLADRINSERKEKIHALELQNEAMRGLKMAEQKLYHRALHDDLTNLPNRKLLQREVPLIIDTALTSSQKLAVVVIRFNRLNEIYNTLGPQSKETLFKVAASRLNETLDTFYNVPTLEKDQQEERRLSVVDDRTFAFLYRLDAELKSNHDIKQFLLERLHQLTHPFKHRGMSIDLDVSVGLALIPDHGLDIDTLLQHAEVAVETAQMERPKIVIYSPTIDPYSAKRLSLMGELREAIRENNLYLEFQPQLDLRQNRIVAVEALLRWNHPLHGPIQPEDTLKMAEQSGQLKALTHWILDTAMRYAQPLIQRDPRMKISINISSKNLREPDLIDAILQKLLRHHIAPVNLNVEITESDMMEDPELALNILTRLASKGIHISIDDFGTGYSSLSYLAALPANEIKIDKNFIQSMNSFEKQLAIVQATITLGRNLGMKVVAEGVEDDDTLANLRSLNCDIAQGFHISRPIPAPQFSDWWRHSSYHESLDREATSS